MTNDERSTKHECRGPSDRYLEDWALIHWSFIRHSSFVIAFLLGVLPMSADLIDLVQRLGQPRVLVVGDLMLDRYIWGDAERISQEAPVILLHADKREERLGGASSVASMLRASGARVALVGVVGADSNAERIRQLLTELGIEHEGLIVDQGRPTTVK